MGTETLVHTSHIAVDNERYEVLVYSRPDGTHVAKTVLDTYDVIINDGSSLDEALKKHTELLPLAINSRQLFPRSRH